MKYFTFKDGKYIEDPEGYLPGIEGLDDNGNSVKLIIHTPDLVGLQNINVGYVYRKLVKPVGFDTYNQIGNDIRVDVNDNNYVDENTGLTVPKEEATEPILDENDEPTGEVEIKQGYDKQLHFFVQSAKGEQSLPDAIYIIMMNQVIQNESEFLKSVHY